MELAAIRRAAFGWDARKLADSEVRFIEGAGIVIGASKQLDSAERDNLTIELMSHEAVDTSAIEVEPLDRDSVQSSIRKHLGLSSDHRRTTPAEAGVAQMMVDLYYGSPPKCSKPNNTRCARSSSSCTKPA